MLPLLVLAAADAIVMDGDFNDWDNVTNTMCVDAFDAAAGGPDLGTTKWTANGDTLHLWLSASLDKSVFLRPGCTLMDSKFPGIAQQVATIVQSSD